MIVKRRLSTRDYWDRDEAASVFVPGIQRFKKDNGRGVSAVVNRAENAGVQELNLSLLFHKYAWWHQSAADVSFEGKFSRPALKNDGKTPKTDKSGKQLTDNETHHYNIEMLEAIAVLSQQQPASYEQILTRHCLAPDGHESVILDMTTITRLLIGLSSQNVFKTGITLHPWYGFPYIPGSSVKGALAHYCQEIDEITQYDEIFGNQKTQGNVTFCDAWPTPWQGSLLTRDIMTPHYPKYYQGKALPTDNDKPNPITILAVKENVTFRFCLRGKDKELLATAMKLLAQSLTTVGVGAKTGSSYGYFKEAIG